MTLFSPAIGSMHFCTTCDKCSKLSCPICHPKEHQHTPQHHSKPDMKFCPHCGKSLTV